MQEIGGYFGMEKFSGKERYGNLISVNSGRNALLYILKARNIKKLFIPTFLCDSVYKLCERENYEYAFYSIDKRFKPIFDGQLSDGEWIYIVNFYGQITQEEVIAYKRKYGNIILDNVQAFFQQPVDGVDTIYSCRKFFGVPDGGYVSTDVRLNESLKPDDSKNKMTHILGRFENTGNEYYQDYKSNEEMFYSLELKAMSKITKNILSGIDYDFVCSRRNENYKIIEKALAKYNKLELTMPNGPYCYPFYCENGATLKQALSKKGIYVPTLWPNVFKDGGTIEKDYAQNILPLPCDQRYDENDMKIVVKELLALRNEMI